MKILDVSLEDGRKCAALINALKIAKFDNLAVQDMESLIDARKWLVVLATEMAKELKGRKEGTASPAPTQGTNGSASPAPEPGIRVKKLTPGSPSKKGKK